MISHKYKFIHAAIPKCGSKSIRGALAPYMDLRGWDDQSSLITHHANFKKIEKYIKEQNLNWDEYFKFLVVRNPWDRLVSGFFHILKQKGKHRRPDQSLWRNSTFRDFIIGKSQVCIDRTFVKKSYMSYMLDMEGKIITDFIIRFENIQKDFDIACDKIGIPRKKLPHKNKTKHKHYSEYYDDETRQIVAEKFAQDIEYFGYEFGE